MTASSSNWSTTACVEVRLGGGGNGDGTAAHPTSLVMKLLSGGSADTSSSMTAKVGGSQRCCQRRSKRDQGKGGSNGKLRRGVSEQAMCNSAEKPKKKGAGADRGGDSDAPGGEVEEETEMGRMAAERWRRWRRWR